MYIDIVAVLLKIGYSSVIQQHNCNTTHTLQVLHLYAVDHALGQLEAPLNKRESEDKEKAVLNSWLNQLRLSHNTINFILNLPSQSELANRTR